MALACPSWLSQRGGALRPAPDGQTWFVLINQSPQFVLQAVPVQGKFGCEIKQTINGRRIESQGTYATEEDALRGGLDELRKSLGW